MTEEFILIEVLPVQSVLNGTANTIVSLDQLHKEHRRHKRDIDKETVRFRKSHRAENKLSVSVKCYIAEVIKIEERNRMVNQLIGQLRE